MKTSPSRDLVHTYCACAVVTMMAMAVFVVRIACIEFVTTTHLLSRWRKLASDQSMNQTMCILKTSPSRDLVHTYCAVVTMMAMAVLCGSLALSL